MEDACAADGKNTATTDFLTTETSGSNLYNLTLQAELTNLASIYTSQKHLKLTATHLLRTEPTFDSVSPFARCTKRSLLPFLGFALSCLMGTATTKDVKCKKNRVNQLTAMQHQQQGTLNSSTYYICFKYHQIHH